MSGARSRRRGQETERMVVNYLRAHGFEHARRYASGDGRQPGDIDLDAGVCLEVKGTQQTRWPSWRAQAVAEARPGDVVAVVWRTPGDPDPHWWETHTTEQDFYGYLWSGRPLRLEVVDCKRTGIPWVVLPFYLFVQQLRGGL